MPGLIAQYADLLCVAYGFGMLTLLRAQPPLR